ncbi:MAG TPA: TIGR03084 family metal-binding protein [Streptosporangiaceae bacterium]|nr:TIGR03084 family metal-binding protein [Streptosporangiaceae bacterium]
MAVSMAALVADLAAESADLTAMLEPLTPGDWERPTPAAGWAIRDQVSHLAFFDEAATLTATDPDRFQREAARLMAAGADFTEVVAREHRRLAPGELLDWLATARAEYLRTFAGLDPAARLPWYGPPMSAASSVTARLMETWAHGQDVADALGVARVPTARLRHIAHLGIVTMAFSFALHGQPVPTAPVAVQLTGPDGDNWSWGPPGAADRVQGDALDFCLLVTQRRHQRDTGLTVTGPTAETWLDLAQAFAGPPGRGRPPRPEGRQEREWQQREREEREEREREWQEREQERAADD